MGTATKHTRAPQAEMKGCTRRSTCAYDMAWEVCVESACFGNFATRITSEEEGGLTFVIKQLPDAPYVDSAPVVRQCALRVYAKVPGIDSEKRTARLVGLASAITGPKRACASSAKRGPFLTTSMRRAQSPSWIILFGCCNPFDTHVG